MNDINFIQTILNYSISNQINKASSFIDNITNKFISVYNQENYTNLHEKYESLLNKHFSLNLK